MGSMARKKRQGDPPDAESVVQPVAKRAKRVRGPHPTQTPLFVVAPSLEPDAAAEVVETASRAAPDAFAETAAEVAVHSDGEDAAEAETIVDPDADLAAALHPAIQEGFHDGFAAIVLKSVGRLGPRAARTATERLREVLMRWAASQPAAVRQHCFGFVLEAGLSLRRADRSSDGIARTISSFGELVEASIGPHQGELLREAAVALVDALATGLLDARAQPADATAALRREVRSLLRRNLD